MISHSLQTPRGAIAVQVDDGLGLPADQDLMTEWCEKAALAAAARLPVWQASPLPWELTVRLGSELESRRLNRDFRGKDYATNVLSFPADEDDAMEEGADEWYVGDIHVCVPVVVKEAAEAKLSLEHHLKHMIVHGVLHLGGHDHMDDHEAEVMERLETEILAGMDIADPYKDSELVREDH